VKRDQDVDFTWLKIGDRSLYEFQAVKTGGLRYIVAKRNKLIALFPTNDFNLERTTPSPRRRHPSFVRRGVI
jgi:hypothetical protein